MPRHRIPKEAANAARKKLTRKQQMFAAEYAVDMNGARAAKSAGYSEASAKEIASENLTKPNVAAEVERRLEQKFENLEISSEYVLGVIRERLELCRSGDDPYAVFKGAELLGRHKKLFTDKLEMSTSDELITRLKAGRKRAGKDGTE